MRCLIWPTSSQRNIDRQLKFVCWIFFWGGDIFLVFFMCCVISSLQRFNVAVTRAKALLIVIGNPFLLAKDPHWNKYVNYHRQTL